MPLYAVGRFSIAPNSEDFVGADSVGFQRRMGFLAA
jgi:hypothetical protein